MPWCPQCKNSYPDDSKTCWICGTELVNTYPVNEDTILSQLTGQPVNGCIQILAVWLTGLIAVITLYILGAVLVGTSTLLAAIVAVSACLQ